jgi:hypothetical protein
MAECAVEGCVKVARKRGWCYGHYSNWQRHGFPGLPPRKTPEERFWEKVEKTDSCWLWTAAKSKGYGAFKVAGRQEEAHRYSYELLVGPIPTGLTIDHLCRNPACVNPAHLEPVTNRENVLRGISPWAKNAAKTHCPQGHPYDEENTRWNSLGSRECKTCRRETWRLYDERRSERRKEEYRQRRLGVGSPNFKEGT